jgi:hypothetical protein
LAQGPEGDRLDLEVGGHGVEVAGRDRRPDVVDVGQGVEETVQRALVVGAAFATLAGLIIEDVGRGAVAGEGHTAVADDDIVGRVTTGQQHGPRRGRQAALDQLTRQARHTGVAVDGGGALGEQVERLGHLDRRPHLLEHRGCLLVQQLALLA